MKNREIERKWLVDYKNIPKLPNIPHIEIVQGYIQDIHGDYIFRLRQCLYFSSNNSYIGEQYFQTIKGKSSMIREEYEIELFKTQFNQLWPLCKDISIHKKRYEIILEENKIHAYLDFYKNKLDGLYTIEVEFDNEIDCRLFVKPDWFGLEVTEDLRYTNFKLAIDGIPKQLTN